MRRIKEFIRVLERENPKGMRWLAIFRGIFVILPYWLLAKDHDRAEWKRRYRICRQCPIFDRDLKRCRPYDGSARGCGCYTPFSNLIYDECWGRQKFGKAIGWSAKDNESRVGGFR